MSKNIPFHEDDWSQLASYRPIPEIDIQRLHDYRIVRVRESLKQSGASLGIFVSPVSLRYAVDYRGYALFQSHIPSSYLFVPVEGPIVLHGAFGSPSSVVSEIRAPRSIAYFHGGSNIEEHAKLLAKDVKQFLSEIGSNNQRIAVEYINPSATQAFMSERLDVIDAVGLIEEARAIKSADEIDCIKWSIAVAELGIEKMYKLMAPGITEAQLWALLNYTNLANNGDWHDGRMLSSGDRVNPWYQEASNRKLLEGDLVAFDTDMVGPFGYCADISRTFFCGSGSPSKRQRQLYQHAVNEIEFNLKLVKPGVSLESITANAYVQPEEFHDNRYVCIMHGVGICDEYPKIYYPQDIATKGYPGSIEENMVICVESYVGAIGERDGVKLEQQVLVTSDGYELLSHYPYDEKLMA